MVTYYQTVRIGRNNRYISLHPYHIFASFLDPRFRHTDCVNENEVEEVWGDLKDYTLSLVEDDNQEVIHANDDQRPNGRRDVRQDCKTVVDFYNSDSEDSDDESIQMNINIHVDKLDEEIAAFRAVEMNRVTKFNINKLRRDDQFDVIAWWNLKTSIYPLLYGSWKRLIIITATSAPSEREWSKLSNIITNNRNRLDCGFVSDLMIVKENNHLLQSYLASLKKSLE